MVESSHIILVFPIGRKGLHVFFSSVVNADDVTMLKVIDARIKGVVFQKVVPLAPLAFHSIRSR